MTPVSTIHRPNTLTYSTAPTVHQDSPRTTRSRLGTVVLRFRAGWWCVLGGVLLSRTLAGAVPSALSGLASGFGMGAGRFPVAVTTETTGWAVRDKGSSLWCVSCYSVVGLWSLACATRTHARACGVDLCGWLVGGLGVDRIVDARDLLWLTPPGLFCLGVGGVVVCVGRISTSQLRPLLVFHFWPINPVVCWGPTRAPQCPVETLS